MSNYRGWRIAEVVAECEAQGVPQPVVCQPYYNLLNRMPEVEILPACDYYGIGVAPYSPIARGVLTGKYAPGAPPPEGSRAARKDRRMMETEFREESFAIAQKLRDARAEDRPHAAAVRARVAVGQPHRDARSSPDRARSSNGRTTSARSARRGATTTRRWSIRWSRPGHPSTPGYNDPQYPFFGRVRRTSTARVIGPASAPALARTANGSRFSGGDSGHDQRASYAHDGLYA